ncbi:MAG: hypothetical protein WC441_05300 [Patescibacteria group bacterium]
MASPAQPLAKCIVRWIYSQLEPILKALKNFLLGIIAFIDAQVAILRAWLAQWDVLAKLEEAAWKLFQTVVDKIRNELTTIPGGPLAEFCPEFYEYFMGPALALFEAAIASLTLFRERFHNMISFMDDIDRLIAYWEQTKANLVAAVEILDDAIYIALQKAASAVP